MSSIAIRPHPRLSPHRSQTRRRRQLDRKIRRRRTRQARVARRKLERIHERLPKPAEPDFAALYRESGLLATPREERARWAAATAGELARSLERVPGVLAVMATAGLYDDSGKWLYHTGLPAKSGVGGGIIAVSPGKFGIAVVSPPLDAAGNSVRAQKAIAEISNALGGNPLSVKKPGTQ